VTLPVYVARKLNIHYTFNALFKKKVKSVFKNSKLLLINGVCTNLRHVQIIVHAVQAANKKKPSTRRRTSTERRY
jgi:hypothetical protein